MIFFVLNNIYYHGFVFFAGYEYFAVLKIMNYIIWKIRFFEVFFSFKKCTNMWFSV